MNLANLPGGDEEEVDDQAEVVTENLRRNSHGNATVNSEENSSLVSMGQGEKRTRFSLSHDEGSIGKQPRPSINPQSGTHNSKNY